jgi:plasmid stabilization system protein ParE
MEQPVKVEWSAAALADLERFANFLAEHHPTMSATAAREIQSKVEHLAEFPRLGRPLARSRNYRQSVLRILNAPYVIRYRLRDQEILVLRVFHGRESRTRVG